MKYLHFFLFLILILCLFLVIFVFNDYLEYQSYKKDWRGGTMHHTIEVGRLPKDYTKRIDIFDIQGHDYIIIHGGSDHNYCIIHAESCHCKENK
jgi:hypothetical protein